MTTYNMAIDKDDSVPVNYLVYLHLNGDAKPGPATAIGTFVHGEDDNLPGMEEHSESHVLFHHVQEALYKRNWSTLAPDFWPDNIVDLHRLKIIKYGTQLTFDYIAATVPANTVVVAATRQITVKAYDAEDVEMATVTANCTYVSSDPTKATVSVGGLVTGVAAGTTNITITYNGKTTIVPMTVTA